MNRKAEIERLQKRVSKLEKLVGGKYRAGVYVSTTQKYNDPKCVSIYEIAKFAAHSLGMKYDLGKRGQLVCDEDKT